MTVRQIPYPAEIRAKGWRFELDHERIEQSDTWALAPPEVRPWLLMLWLTAWKQSPCGSMADDDALIAARIGMPCRLFAKHAAVLRRGWWAAEDGRLYHDTIVELVNDMMTRRRNESDRKAKARAKKEALEHGIPMDVPDVSHGTDTGVHPQSDTGTGTGITGTQYQIPNSARAPNSVRALAVPDVSRGTDAGEACKAMRQAGMTSVNPSDPRLLALLDAGATVPEFGELAAEAVPKGKGFGWVLVAVEGRRRDAAKVVSLPAPQREQKPWDGAR